MVSVVAPVLTASVATSPVATSSASSVATSPPFPPRDTGDNVISLVESAASKGTVVHAIMTVVSMPKTSGWDVVTAARTHFPVSREGGR